MRLTALIPSPGARSSARGGDGQPQATRQALSRHQQPKIFVLAPESEVSKKAGDSSKVAETSLHAAQKGAQAVILIHTNQAAGYGWQVVRNSWGRERSYVRLKTGQPSAATAVRSACSSFRSMTRSVIRSGDAARHHQTGHDRYDTC